MVVTDSQRKQKYLIPNTQANVPAQCISSVFIYLFIYTLGARRHHRGLWVEQDKQTEYNK